MRDFKNISLSEFTTILPTLTQEEYVQILSGNPSEINNYANIIALTIGYLIDTQPQLLKSELSSSFWIKYAQTKENFLVSETLCNSPIGSEIFSNENLYSLLQNEDFVNYVFQTFPRDKKLKTIDTLLTSANNVDLQTLSNIINNTYTKSNFEHFKVSTAISAPNPTKQQRDSYENLILNSSPSYFQKYFNDPTKRQLFLDNFNLLSALSIHDRTALFNTVDLKSLSNMQMQNIVKLLYNGYPTNFNDGLFKNPNFVNQYLLGTNITDFRRMVKTLEFSHPQLSKALVEAKDRQLDKIINNKKENYPVVQFSNGDSDNFWNVAVYRYFKTCPHDLYITTVLIQDSRTSLNIDNKISNEGKNLLDSLAKIASIKDTEYFTKSKLHSIKHKKLLNNALENIKEYNQKFGEIDLSHLVETCRKEFAQTMFNQLTTKNSPGVQEQYIGNQKVYDITNCENISLLIHSTNSDKIPTVNPGKEQLISMSLLDNNHLRTFVRDAKFVYGYNSGHPDSVIHAYTTDSMSLELASSENILYEKVSSYAPIYTDIETFMNETGQTEESYNEIKFRAAANSRNSNNQDIMKPDYILYKSGDLSTLPEYLVDFANKNNIDIFTINPQKVQRKTYEHSLNKKHSTLRGAEYIEQ